MLNKIACYLGRRSKRFRLWYHKKTGGFYPWGLFQFIQDFGGELKEPLTTTIVEKLWDNITLKTDL